MRRTPTNFFEIALKLPFSLSLLFFFQCLCCWNSYCFITSHNSALLQISTNKSLLLDRFIFIHFHPLYHLLCHHYLLLTHFTCCLMRPQSEQRQWSWHFSSNKCELSAWSENAAAAHSQETIHIYKSKGLLSTLEVEAMRNTGKGCAFTVVA